MSLQGKRILLGVTGGIAAYKACELLRLLVKAGADVEVMMTKAAAQFVGPLTFETLSGKPVAEDMWDPKMRLPHISLRKNKDLIVIAPATANIIAKAANGIADDLVSSTLLARECPLMLCPAMNVQMWRNAATGRNIQTLEGDGVLFSGPEAGSQACGDVGEGRLREPVQILEDIEAFFTPPILSGKKVLITAGPTYEKIDPVRFIGNYSSGKMGFALAEACAEAGAEVMLVAGPVSLKTNHSSINRIDVESAEEMYRAVLSEYDRSDIAIMCAAVADYAPETVSDVKLKRTGEDRILRLRPNPDIAAELGRRKRPGQCLVGFALETNDEEMNARLKMEKKNLDFIVLNSLRDAGAGFQCDTNKVTVIGKQGEPVEIPCKPKIEVAADIVDIIGRYVSEDR